MILNDVFLYDYYDPELKAFLKIGSKAIDLRSLETQNIDFSIFETSSGPDDLDYPFNADIVTMRPGLWYALNLSVGGEKKSYLAQLYKYLESHVKNNFGDYFVSFMLVVPPGSKIPQHRHFRENSSLVFCIPSAETTTGLAITIEDITVNLKRGYIHFDSRKMHSAINQTEQTYWIFVFENVRCVNNPVLNLVEI